MVCMHTCVHVLTRTHAPKGEHTNKERQIHFYGTTERYERILIVFFVVNENILDSLLMEWKWNTCNTYKSDIQSFMMVDKKKICIIYNRDDTRTTVINVFLFLPIRNYLLSLFSPSAINNFLSPAASPLTVVSSLYFSCLSFGIFLFHDLRVISTKK